MSPSTISSLADFHRLVGVFLEEEASEAISADEVFLRWDERQNPLSAIRERIADVGAGRTVSLEDDDRAVRLKHGIQEAS